MLPQPHRLHRAGEIRQLRQQGRAWRHPLAILLVTARQNEHPEEGRLMTRFAVSASRQVGNAVVRNRAKRLLRETIRQHLDEIETGWNCLLIARPLTSKATFAEVETAVLQLLSRARLILPPVRGGGKEEIR